MFTQLLHAERLKRKQTLSRQTMADLLIVLFVLVGYFLWEHRTWLPVFREEQAHQQRDQDFEVAVRRGDIPRVRWLLAHGADLHMNQPTGAPVAFEAASADMAALFLSRGFNVNTTEKDGETLLSTAASEADVVEVRFLIRHGANVSVQGANALANARAGMEDAEDEARAPLPPDGGSGNEDDEDVRAADACRPWQAVIAVLHHAGAHE